MISRRDALALGAGTVIAASAFPAFGAARQDGSSGFYMAPASGDQQVPTVDTEARGGALFAYDEEAGALHYSLAADDIENVTMAHIHMAPPGENGPVVVWLYPAPEVQSPRMISGPFSGVLATGIITDGDLGDAAEDGALQSLVDEMAAGNTYVNVHTEQNPDGEVRGQIMSVDDILEAVEPMLADEGTATATPATETDVATETATEVEDETPTATATEDEY